MHHFGTPGTLSTLIPKRLGVSLEIRGIFLVVIPSFPRNLIAVEFSEYSLESFVKLQLVSIFCQTVLWKSQFN